VGGPAFGFVFLFFWKLLNVCAVRAILRHRGQCMYFGRLCSC